MAGTEFCLLGPLVVRHDDVLVPVAPGKQRVLLAALLLNANQVVSMAELVETLWEGSIGPPASARVTVQNYIKRLRIALRVTGSDRIHTGPDGYVINVEVAEFDVARFVDLATSGGRAAAADAWEMAERQAHAALALWRGDPLTDVPSDSLALREVPRLKEIWLQAVETHIDAVLHLGGHGGLIAELRDMVDRYPLREHLRAQLMLALACTGQQAEALVVYQHARQTLVDELGIEPGAELRQVHTQILTGDITTPSRQQRRIPASDVEPVATPVVTRRHTTAPPRQLPATVPHFTGRTTELATLTKLLAEQPGGAVMISAIGGAGGIGKTALALHWAHQITDRFPDGQLYVDLRGYHPDQPMSAIDAVGGFLQALGVDTREIPVELEARAARYRSELAGRQMLVVLDNAHEAQQVRPLLPGTGSCVVLVTSRNSLPGLVAKDGARRVDLGPLPSTDAVALLGALIGERVHADPDATAALAEHCCRLPLALRVAAEFAAARPEVPLARLADELGDQHQRLDLLDAGGDRYVAVRAVFSWSYRNLEVDTARAFRLLGLHPGRDLDVHAAAALVGTSSQQVARLLDQLSRAYLIQAQPGRGDRYGMHDLLHAYARERTAEQDTTEERRAALTNLADHYLHTAAVAMDILFPAERHRRPPIAPIGAQSAMVIDAATAREWLDDERANLVALAAHTAARGWPDHTTRLAAILYRYLDVGGHYPEAIALHTHARDAALNGGDQAAHAQALSHLGSIDWRQGRYPQATDQLQQALVLFRAIGDNAGEARVLTNLGAVDWHQGRYVPARDQLSEALALFRATGDRSGEARVLGNLGLLDVQQENYRQSEDHYGQALAAFREIGDRTGQAWLLCNLGELDQKQGRHRQAADHLRAALTLFRESGDRSGEANALNELGIVVLSIGHPNEARVHHVDALALAGEIGDQIQQAHAHTGLGHAHQALAEHEQARRHWQQALALYEVLGAPNADQIRNHLATTT